MLPFCCHSHTCVCVVSHCSTAPLGVKTSTRYLKNDVNYLQHKNTDSSHILAFYTQFILYKCKQWQFVLDHLMVCLFSLQVQCEFTVWFREQCRHRSPHQPPVWQPPGLCGYQHLTEGQLGQWREEAQLSVPCGLCLQPQHHCLPGFLPGLTIWKYELLRLYTILEM